MMSSDHVPVSFEVRFEVFRHQVVGLSRIRRWNGACDVSVAKHYRQASDLASSEAAAYVLIHDIEEFDTGDITTPVKNTMRALGVWQRFESKIVLPIRRRFSLLAGLVWSGLVWSWPEGVIEEAQRQNEQHQMRVGYDNSIASRIFLIALRRWKGLELNQRIRCQLLDTN
ncbi:hypothetical protein [Terasakiella pusilla]